MAGADVNVPHSVAVALDADPDPTAFFNTAATLIDTIVVPTTRLLLLVSPSAINSVSSVLNVLVQMPRYPDPNVNEPDSEINPSMNALLTLVLLAAPARFVL
jgi:hypothetical protein